MVLWFMPSRPFSRKGSWWKMFKCVDLRLSLCSFHTWMTAWLDTAVWVRPRSLENTLNVSSVTFEIDRGVELISSPSPRLENCSPWSLKCRWFPFINSNKEKSKTLKFPKLFPFSKSGKFHLYIPPIMIISTWCQLTFQKVIFGNLMSEV